MTYLLTTARKTGAAILGAVVAFAVLVLMSDPAKIQPEEWASLLIGLATALGVWKATNGPARLVDWRERGAVDVVTVLVVIALLLLILWLLGVRVGVN